MVKVSVVVPVYNVENYLRECLDSAVNQTLDDIEIICVNDGSTDGSLDILREYENKYDNLRIINQENKGLGGARNTGIENACGKYIYFLDSDDYILLDAMEICYEESEKNKLDILTFDADCFYDDKYSGDLMNEEYDRSSKMDGKVIDGRSFYIKSNELDIYKAPVWLNFYNLQFIRKNNLFFVEDMIHEDEVHTLQSLLKAKRVKYTDNKLFKRRFRDNSIMTRGSNEKRIDGNIIVIKEIQKIYMDNKSDDELKSILNKNINFFIRRAIWHSDNLSNFNKRNEIKNLVFSIDKLVNIDIILNKPNLVYNNNISSSNKLINRNFTIVSNNCWGGAVYNKFGLRYNTPFIGLFIFAPDYIKLLKNFKELICKEVKFINPNNSKYKEELIKYGTLNKYPIGCIDDIELHFLHYKSEEEAYEKWNRRVVRMNLDNLLIKFSDRDLCTENLIKEFEKLDFKNKLCFTAKKYDNKYIIHFAEFENENCVDNEMYCYDKYIDIIDILNKLIKCEVVYESKCSNTYI